MPKGILVFRIRFRSRLRISVGFGDWLRIGDGDRLVDVMSMFGSGLIPGFGLTDRKSFPVSAPDRGRQRLGSDRFLNSAGGSEIVSGLGSVSGSTMGSGSSAI